MATTCGPGSRDAVTQLLAAELHHLLRDRIRVLGQLQDRQANIALLAPQPSCAITGCRRRAWPLGSTTTETAGLGCQGDNAMHTGNSRDNVGNKTTRGTGVRMRSVRAQLRSTPSSTSHRARYRTRATELHSGAAFPGDRATVIRRGSPPHRRWSALQPRMQQNRRAFTTPSPIHINTPYTMLKSAPINASQPHRGSDHETKPQRIERRRWRSVPPSRQRWGPSASQRKSACRLR